MQSWVRSTLELADSLLPKVSVGLDAEVGVETFCCIAAPGSVSLVASDVCEVLTVEVDDVCVIASIDLLILVFKPFLTILVVRSRVSLDIEMRI